MSVVDLANIEAEDWALNISRYVQPLIGDIPALKEALADLRQALQKAKAGEDSLRAVLAETGMIQ